jgi:hypothetical protein
MDKSVKEVFEIYKTISFKTLSDLIGTTNEEEIEDIISHLILHNNLDSAIIEDNFVVRRDPRSISFKVLDRIAKLTQRSID